jgi:hypothetical protein
MFFDFGRHKCFQMRHLNPALGKNTVERSDEWTWGIFFYSLAFPMAIVNNLINFIPFRGTGPFKTSLMDD